MTIYFQVCDKVSGLVIGKYTDREQAKQHKQKDDNYFISVRFDD